MASLVYWGAAALAARAWLTRRSDVAVRGELEPLTFLRPIKPGVPDLEGKLRALVESARAGDQVLLGVTAGSAEERFCSEWVARLGDARVELVPCPAADARFLNPKIAKLTAMSPRVRSERVILSDAELLTEPGRLDRLRAEWQATGAEAITCAYRFAGLQTLPQQLDAMATLLTLLPGLAVTRRWGRLDFTLGACTGFAMSAVRESGGWERYGEYLAEDFWLGRALATKGRRVVLSEEFVTLDSDPLTWREYWRHQRRVALTYRVSQPAGFAGMIFTHGVTAALLWLAVQPSMAAALGLATAWGARATLAQMLARRSGFLVPYAAWWIPAASVVETIGWVGSWLERRVWWSGQWRRVGAGGRLLRGHGAAD